jgi:hypothetical protein
MAKQFTVGETATIFGLTPAAIRVRIQRGHMKAERFGARVLLISEREVNKWRGQGRLKTGPKPKRKLQRVPK